MFSAVTITVMYNTTALKTLIEVDDVITTFVTEVDFINTSLKRFAFLKLYAVWFKITRKHNGVTFKHLIFIAFNSARVD